MNPETNSINVAPTPTLPNKNLVWFFVLSFAITWSILAVAILNERNIIALPLSATLFVALATIGPMLAALLITARESGWRGVRALLGQCVRWRVPWIWYAAALVIPALILLGAFALWSVLGGVALPPPTLEIWFSIPLLIISLLLFALFEEIGWRGFAFARLQQGRGALFAALVVGVVHASWHLPIWFLPGLGFDDLPFPFYALLVISLSVIFGWLYNSTGASLLLVALFHAALNAYPAPWGNALLALPADARGMNIQIPVAIVTAIFAVIVITLTKRNTLTQRN